MTAPTDTVPAANTRPEALRPGSRAARFALPLAVHALRDLAIKHGVCIRPIVLRRTDLATGVTEVIDLPCGATREDKCPSCATRAKRLRQVQIREGWHRTGKPNPGPQPATPEQEALIVLRAHFEVARAQRRTAHRLCQARAPHSPLNSRHRCLRECRSRRTAHAC
jgi:hypothetical protein